MLLNFIKNGLDNTDSGLGDRSKYIGSSDIGQCFKKSYLSKTIGEEHSLKQLLIFQRGHIAEGIIRDGLSNNPQAKIDFKEQVEVEGKDDISFIKTHIDFVVDFPKEKLVIECKTISSPLPNNKPRESWLYQVQLQMALLKQTTNKNVRGKIVAFNLNSGEALEFDVDFNQSLCDIAIKRAKSLWQSVQSKTEPDGEVGDLCAYCPFKGKCNTLRKSAENLPNDVVAAVDRLDELKPLIQEEKAIKDNIKAFMSAANMKKGLAGKHTISISERNGRDTVDINALKNSYPEIAKKVISKGSSYSTLKVF